MKDKIQKSFMFMKLLVLIRFHLYDATLDYTGIHNTKDKEVKSNINLTKENKKSPWARFLVFQILISLL